MKLTSITVKDLQYFIGKVCTILTNYNGLKLKDKEFVDFFVGRVESISEDCICISHLETGQKSVFFDVISISEEQLITTDHPEYTELTNQINQNSPLTLDSLKQQIQQFKS